jgi:hypothetical protein
MKWSISLSLSLPCCCLPMKHETTKFH